MARDLAIDLGTANTLVWSRGQGIVLNEPTVVALNTRNGDVLSMGHEAYAMTTTTPSHIVADRPLRSGVITDFETTARLLRLVFGRIGLSRFSRPRALLCVPGGLTGVERRALVQAAEQAGAARAQLLEQPMAAAVGAGLPVHEPIGSMVVDVGGGTTQVAVISLGGVVATKGVRVGGFDLDAAIQAYVRREHAMAIGDRAAEQLKIEIGSAFPRAIEPRAEIRGRDLGTGRPRTELIGAEEVREAITDCVGAIVNAISATLADCHPELTHDVITGGLELTGGGALLHGLDSRIAQESQISVRVTDQPLTSVVTGAGRTVEEADDFRDLFAG